MWALGASGLETTCQSRPTAETDRSHRLATVVAKIAGCTYKDAGFQGSFLGGFFPPLLSLACIRRFRRG